MAADANRRLFSVAVDGLLHEARRAAGDDQSGPGTFWPTRAQYERTCANLGVAPEDDDECDPPEFGEDDVRAAAAAKLHRERGTAYAYELRERRSQLMRRYPNGVDRATYERLCGEAAIEPAADSDIDALSREGHGLGIDVLPAMRVDLAQLRRLGRASEWSRLSPWHRSSDPYAPDPYSATAQRDGPGPRQPGGIGGVGSIPEIITTAVVTAALVPFVQAIAAKAGEDVYRAVRRLLPRLLPSREERPHVQTIEVVDPDTRTRLRLDVDLPADAVERLAEVDEHAVQASDRLIYWDRERRRWTVR